MTQVTNTPETAVPTVGDRSTSDHILGRIAQVTRTLRDATRELGINRQVERVAKAVPDAHDRLAYIARMNEQAAEKALVAVDVAKPLQDRLMRQASALDMRWRQWYEIPIDHDAVLALITETRQFLRDAPGLTSTTNSQLMEIMLAQDFQDLTGQVIRKVTDIVHMIEEQLIKVLLDNIVPERREQFATTVAALARESLPAGNAGAMLKGPSTGANDEADMVNDQSHVDDLLSSLGF